MTCIALLEMARAHLNLRLLRRMRISLANCHVDLVIVLLITGAVLRIGQAAARRRLQVAVVQVPAVETTL